MLEKGWLVQCVVRRRRESRVLVVVPNEQSETVDLSCDWTAQQAVISDDTCGVQIVCQMLCADLSIRLLVSFLQPARDTGGRSSLIDEGSGSASCVWWQQRS